MARNAEKAMTTLARWRQSQLEAESGSKQRRPFLASDCDDLKEAEKWRLDIIREISKKVTQIQNAGLGEFRIRDLNDQINKLLREKRHWEYRIKELGGIHYRRSGGPSFEKSGKEVVGNRGYKYFGAAKDLPGVRELFSQEPPLMTRKTRAELMKDIDADYYGFRDEDDGLIVKLEAEVQKELLLKALENDSNNEDLSQSLKSNFDTIANDEEEEEDVVGLSALKPMFVSHVAIPSQQEVQQELVRRKKQELISQLELYS